MLEKLPQGKVKISAVRKPSNLRTSDVPKDIRRPNKENVEKGPREHVDPHYRSCFLSQRVDLGRQDEVVFGQTVCGVGPNIQPDLIIKNMNIGVMPFGLRDLGNFVYKNHCFLEVAKLKIAGDLPDAGRPVINPPRNPLQILPYVPDVEG